MKWSQEDTEKLVALWPTYSMTQIGNHLGYTRNAVAGKIYRMNLNLSHGERSFRQGPKRIMTKMRLKPIKIQPPKEAPIGKEVSLLNRTLNECSYLIAPQTCCGGKTHKVIRRGELVRTAWCPFHYNIVYQPNRKRTFA